MGIYIRNNSVQSIFLGNIPVQAVYAGAVLVWPIDNINSCYAAGYWIDEYPWTDDTPWTD